jgi:hypothetical protein
LLLFLIRPAHVRVFLATAPRASEESGGPSGIQDSVFIVGPGGVRYEYIRALDS